MSKVVLQGHIVVPDSDIDAVKAALVANWLTSLVFSEPFEDACSL